MLHIFIINPYAGKQRFSEGIREKLSEMNDLKYFVFNTRYAGYEKELVERLCNIFEGEKLRFYCCGGSGTLRNVINALGDNIDKYEVAFYPCGYTNDYLKIFGDQEKKFYKLENLINGKVIDVDYIKTNHGIAINTISVGVDATYVDCVNKNQALCDISYNLGSAISFMMALFHSDFTKYSIEIDGKEYENAFTELVVGNGVVFGGSIRFAKSSKVNDGKSHYMLLPYRNFLKRLSAIINLSSGKLETASKNSDIGMCQKFTIKRLDNKPFYMNYDGEMELGTEFSMEMVQKGLRMVVPMEVSIDG